MLATSTGTYIGAVTGRWGTNVSTRTGHGTLHRPHATSTCPCHMDTGTTTWIYPTVASITHLHWHRNHWPMDMDMNDGSWKDIDMDMGPFHKSYTGSFYEL